MLFNKNTYRKTNDKKLLHKIGKRWVTVSIAMLALLGGSVVMKSVTTHASVVPNSRQQTVAVKNNLNRSLQKPQPNNTNPNQNVKASTNNPKTIQSSATDLHNKLVSNSIGKTNSVASGSTTQSSSNSNAGSSSTNSATNKSTSSSNNGMTTLNLGTESEQNRSWNYVEHRSNLNDRTPVNNSGSSAVNDKASGNQTTPLSSFSAKSDTIPSSAPIHQKGSYNSAYMSYEAQMNGTDSKVASINANIGNSNIAKNKRSLIEDDNSTQIFKTTGFTYKWNKYTKTLELVNGQSSNPAVPIGYGDDDLYSDGGNDVLASGIKHFIIDSDANFNNINDYNLDHIFQNDNALQTLTINNSLNSSQRSSLNSMFAHNFNLQVLTLPNNFDTSNVHDVTGMFSSDSSLNTIVLPNTTQALIGLVNCKNTGNISNGDYPSWFDKAYQRDSNDNYTSTQPVDLLDGQAHGGIWVSQSNPVPTSDTATINYQYKGNTIKLITPKQKFGTSININDPLSNTIYEAINPNQSVEANGNSYTISVDIDYQKEIDKLNNEVASADGTISNDQAYINWLKSSEASLTSASKSANDADKWVQNNSNSASNADKWVNKNGSTVSNNASNGSTQANSNSGWIHTNSASLSSASTSASDADKWIQGNSSSASSADEWASENSTSVKNMESSFNTAYSDASSAYNYYSTSSSAIASASKSAYSAWSYVSKNSQSITSAWTSASNAWSYVTSESNSISSAESFLDSNVKNSLNTAYSSANSAYNSLTSAKGSVKSAISQATKNSQTLSNNENSFNSAYSSASNAMVWINQNSSGILSATTSANSASTNASNALASVNADQQYINWLNSSEGSLTSATTQATSNDNWIKANSGSVSALNGDWTSVNNQISNDSKALDNAINTKADANTLNTDYANLSGDIKTASNIASDASKVANSDNTWITNNSGNLNNASKEAHSASTSANTNAESIVTNSNDINTNSTNATNDANIAQGNAESYTNTSITPINTNMTNLSNSANTDYTNATSNINNKATSLSGATTSLSGSANTGIRSNATNIHNLSSSASNALNTASKDIKANTRAINNLSDKVNNNLSTVNHEINTNKTNADRSFADINRTLNDPNHASGSQLAKDIKNIDDSLSTKAEKSDLNKAKADLTKLINNNGSSITNLDGHTKSAFNKVNHDITNNKSNADKAINDINKALKDPDHANGKQLAKDIDTINKSLSTKEAKSDFAKTVSNINGLINTKADNAKILNDEKDLQNSIDTKADDATTMTNLSNLEDDLNAVNRKFTPHKSIAKEASKPFYIMINKPMWLHSCLKFSKYDRVGKILKPNTQLTFKIERVFNVNGRIRIEIRVHNHNYFITGRSDYVSNAYVQPKEFKHYKHIRVIHGAFMYRSHHYTRKNRVRFIRKGTKLEIKSIKTIASKHMTRIQLTNGLWFTANKNFVKLIK